METTDNGFYIGDTVETPDRKRSMIMSIEQKGINYHRNDFEFCDVTLVSLTNGEFWLDIQLTRVS